MGIKKATALFLAAMLLFLCACSGNETQPTENQQTAATLPINQAQSKAAAETKDGWNSSVLPESFAHEPQGCKTISTQIIPASRLKSEYTVEAVRITLRCLPEQMDAFSEEMVSLGYVGGICFYKGSEIYGDKVVGHWTNDEYLATISDSKESIAEKDGLRYTLTLDVVKCENGVPEVLKKGFSEVKTCWTRADGEYYGINAIGIENAEPDETLSDVNWMWKFRDEDAFIGVTSQEYEDYLLQLTVLGFEGYAEVESDEYGEIVYYSAEYSYDNNSFGVYLCYITYLSTLEIIYSNDISYFYGEETTQSTEAQQ